MGGTHSLTDADLVAINPLTGKIVEVATGFDNPITSSSDGGNRLLISDYGSSKIYTVQSVPEPMSLIARGGAIVLSLRKRKRRH